MTPTEILSGINGGGTSATYTPTFSGSASIGDCVVVLVMGDSVSTLPGSMTDSVGNVYTAAAGACSWGSTRRAGFYYCLSLTANIVGGSTTLQFATGGANHKTMLCWKMTGATFTFDKQNLKSAQSTATPNTNSTGTLSSATEVAFAAYGYDTASPNTFTPTSTPNVWNQTATTQQQATGGACSISAQYLDVPGTTALNPTATIGSSVVDGAFIITISYTAGSTPVVTGNPSITGNPQVGQVLTCVDGSASGSPAPTVSGRQWKRDGVNIGGATGTTYTLIGADQTHTITVAVTWTNTGGSAVGTSAGVGPIGFNYVTGTDSIVMELCDNSTVNYPTLTSYPAGTVTARIELGARDTAFYLSSGGQTVRTSTRWRAPLLRPQDDWKGSQENTTLQDDDGD